MNPIRKLVMLKSQVLEYIWLDASQNFRSKVKVLNNNNRIDLSDLSQIPVWNYDGSSTGQAQIQDSEVLLHPKKVYTNSILINFPVLVLCDTYNPKTNARTSYYDAEQIFKKYEKNEPMFGLEQEFYMYNTKGEISEKTLEIASSGAYYCSVGPQCSRTRKYILDVMYMAIQLGIKVTGMNYEVAPGQAELQVCNIGLDACYDLLMIRYLLVRLGENYNIVPNFEPKILSDENGSGCHINFSTLEMRQMTNVTELHQTIHKMCKNLEKEHTKFIDEYYGVGNKDRLSGSCETCSYQEFKIKKGGRNASIRVPNEGNYFEDRRPSSNIDPYLACSKLLECVME